MRRSRGASAVEYIIVTLFVAIAGVVGWAQLGAATKCKIAMATGIFAGGSSGAPGCADSSAPVAMNNSPNPSNNSNNCLHGSCMAPGNCFVAGTPVVTEEGPLPIEAITVGMRVLSRDEEGDALGWKPVLRAIRSESRSLVRLTLVDARGRQEALELTPSHALHVEGRGWIAARALVPGQDVLVDAAGAAIRVQAAVSLPDEAPVYNLEVADYHTYFVGEQQVWAHNDNAVPPIIHTYWAGGDLPESQFENVKAWAEKAQQGGGKYDVVLWTAPPPNGISPEQQKALEAQGVTVRRDTRDQIPKSMQYYYDQAIKTKSWALASDIGRYGFVPKNGGIYIDVDMHPGTVDLSKDPPKPPKANTPLFFPLLRDQDSWDRAKDEWKHKNPGAKDPTPQDIFDHLYGKAKPGQAAPPVFNNNMFVTEKDSTFFNNVYDHIRDNFDQESQRKNSVVGKKNSLWCCKEGKPYLTGKADTDLASYLSGPFPINAILKSDPNAKLTDENWINNVNWITDSSTREPPAPPPQQQPPVIALDDDGREVNPNPCN
jgi:Pretoxin HINT domain/Glycosyltransferase sugar-binding region containing DXD motif